MTIHFKKDSGENVMALEADIDNGNSGLVLYDVAGTQETARLTGAHLGTPGAFLTPKNTAGHPTIQLDAQKEDQLGAAGGFIELADDDGNTTISLLAKPVSTNPLFEYGSHARRRHRAGCGRGADPRRHADVSRR